MSTGFTIHFPIPYLSFTQDRDNLKIKLVSINELATFTKSKFREPPAH